jgi:hypothetical protein
MTSAFTIECRVHLNNRGRGSRKGPPSDRAASTEAGRVPRVSRLMALAMRFDELIRSGQVTGYAELARLGHVTRARVSQIASLLGLAPDLQEEILFLPRTLRGRTRFSSGTCCRSRPSPTGESRGADGSLWLLDAFLFRQPVGSSPLPY